MSWLFFLSPALHESRGASLRALSLTQGSKSIFMRLLDSGFLQEQKSDCIQMGISFLFSFAFHVSSFHSYL